MCSDFNTSGQALTIEPTRVVNSNRNLAKNVEAHCSSPAKYLVWDYFQKYNIIVHFQQFKFFLITMLIRDKGSKNKRCKD